MLLNVFFSVTYVILLHVHYSLNLLVTNQVFVVGVTTEGTMERMLLQSQSSMFLISIFFIDNLTKKLKTQIIRKWWILALIISQSDNPPILSLYKTNMENNLSKKKRLSQFGYCTRPYWDFDNNLINWAALREESKEEINNLLWKRKKKKKVNQKWTQLILGPLKSQCRVKLRPRKLSVTSEGRCHRIPCRLRAALAYQTGGGGAQLGQIEARPFVWVTVKTLICMQAYRPLGSTGLTLSHTLIYVLISPSVLFSSSLSPSLPLSSHHFHFLSPHFSPSQTTCFFFFCFFFTVFN